MPRAMPTLRARSHAALRAHATESARHSHVLAILEDLPLAPPLAQLDSLSGIRCLRLAAGRRNSAPSADCDLLDTLTKGMGVCSYHLSRNVNRTHSLIIKRLVEIERSCLGAAIRSCIRAPSHLCGQFLVETRKMPGAGRLHRRDPKCPSFAYRWPAGIMTARAHCSKSAFPSMGLT